MTSNGAGPQGQLRKAVVGEGPSALVVASLGKSRPAKPPAVLIRVLEGRNFAETIGSIKAVVDFPALWSKVRKIRKTKDGHALVEFSKSPGAYAAANRLDEAIRSRPDIGVGRVAFPATLSKRRSKTLTPRRRARMF